MSLTFEVDPDQVRFEVEITVADGSSELYLVNQGAVLIAQGVGKLQVNIAPGRYTVRQRVGYEQQVHTIEVSQKEQFVFPAVAFSSPLPLQGTTLGQDLALGQYLVAKGSHNFQLLLWTPNAQDQARLEDIFAQLQLEHFQTRERVSLNVNRRNNAIVASATLSVGPYQLVQLGKTGERRCLPLWSVEGWVTSVYLLALTDQLSGKPMAVELDHAAMTLLRPGLEVKDVEGSLRRLEAARKTLQLGRRMPGWSTWRGSDAEPENPMLALLDAQLGAGRANLLEILHMPFPDARLLSADQPPDLLGGPPLLRHSWNTLVQTPDAALQLQSLFGRHMRVDATGVWLVWSELPVAARRATSRKRVIYELAAQLAVARDKPSVPGARIRQASLERVLIENLSRLTERHLESIITQVFQSEAFMNAWNDSHGGDGDKRFQFEDPRVQRLFSALLVLTDKTLVQAIGAPELVRQALKGLRLPAWQANQLSWSLLQALLSWVGVDSSTTLSRFLTSIKLAPNRSLRRAANVKLERKEEQVQQVLLAAAALAAEPPSS